MALMWITDANGNVFPAWHTYANQTATSTGCNWPLWQFDNGTGCVSNIITTSSTDCTPSTLYWPTWHENIAMPAIIRERTTILEEKYNREYEERRRQRQEAEAKRKVADERAKQILLEHLTPEQRDTVEKNGWFTIEGGRTGKIYRIKSKVGVSGNIEELDPAGKVIASYCCHLSHDHPQPDHHLAQKLMLEWDEDEFLRLANKTMRG